MSRRIPHDKIAKIADARINRLAELSGTALRNGRKDRAQRYVSIALHICQKTRRDMPEGFVFCKKCHMPLVPGINQTVRLNSAKLVSTCGECGNIRRMPYIKEKRK